MLKACVTSVFSLALCWTLLSANFVCFRAVAVDVFSLALCRTWLSTNFVCFRAVAVGVFSVALCWTWLSTDFVCFRAVAVGVFSVALWWTWLSVFSVLRCAELDCLQILSASGRSLSVLASSQMIVNPDIPEAHLLRGWYDREGVSMDFSSFRNDGPSGCGWPWTLSLHNPPVSCQVRYAKICHSSGVPSPLETHGTRFALKI